MKRFRQILVVLSDSPADRTALQWARLIAKSASAEQIHVLVLDPDPADWVPEYPAVKDYEPWKDRIHDAAELVSEVFDKTPGVSVKTKASVGAPLPTILAELEKGTSDLVVLGVADDADRRLAEQLARKSPASVLSVPADATAQCRLILTPLDFSAPSSLALEISEAFARSFDSRINALHSYRIPSRAIRAGLPVESLRASYHDTASERLADYLQEKGHPACSPRPVVREAVLASGAVLAELAEHPYDLVIMATRGRSSLSRALLGSNTADVLRRSPLPVLAVKAKGEGLPLLRLLLGTSRSTAPGLAPPS